MKCQNIQILILVNIMCKIYEISWEELYVSFLIELQNHNTWCLCPFFRNKNDIEEKGNLLTHVYFSNQNKQQQSAEKFHIEFCIVFLKNPSFRYKKEGTCMQLTINRLVGEVFGAPQAVHRFRPPSLYWVKNTSIQFCRPMISILIILRTGTHNFQSFS